ncbi:MAG: hypothetical protein MZW92_60755 [Comamonadaceae bacterium]|nr:hypothetical protein [Comamonadaceae bacterium]
MREIDDGLATLMVRHRSRRQSVHRAPHRLVRPQAPAHPRCLLRPGRGGRRRDPARCRCSSSSRRQSNAWPS